MHIDHYYCSSCEFCSSCFLVVFSAGCLLLLLLLKRSLFHSFSFLLIKVIHIVVGELYCWKAKHTLNFCILPAYATKRNFKNFKVFQKRLPFFTSLAICFMWRCNNQQTVCVTTENSTVNGKRTKKNTFAAAEINQLKNHKWIKWQQANTLAFFLTITTPHYSPCAYNT